MKLQSYQLVSVVVPVYNGENFIRDALNSIYSQQDVEVEVIVVDDASDDATATIVQSEYPQVKYVLQPRSGAAAARNSGIKHCVGEFIAFLDADDLWTSGKLAVQLAILNGDPSVSMVFGYVNEFAHAPDEAVPQLIARGVAKRGHSPITMLARKEVFREVGLFDEQLAAGEFIDWFSRASDSGIREHTISDVLAWRRVHEHNRAKYGKESTQDYARVARLAIMRRRQSTPVALFIFNRAETVRALLSSLRAANVSRLFVIADGPREGVCNDALDVTAARDVLNTIDWRCEVEVLAAPHNLGLKASFERGMAWVFEQVNEVIVLEDDCLPEPSFFRYCNELLQRYEPEKKVMSISGQGVCDSLKANGPSSYIFSRYPLIWGWATWRDRWAHYDGTMRDWGGALNRDWLSSIFDDPRAVDYWDYLLTKNASDLEHWDYAWILSCWKARGLTIHPRRNLVSNIGFGTYATHTADLRSVFSKQPVTKVDFPLVEPRAIESDAAWDSLVEARLFSGNLKSLFKKVHDNLKCVGS